MQVHQINFYKDFICAMEQCPDTCCHGWRVPLDSETEALYRRESGAFGRKLRRSVIIKDEIPSINKWMGYCPFLDAQRLCSLQKEHDISYQPRVCRAFPRDQVNFGAFSEESLELSCPQAARLFLESATNLHYVNLDFPVAYPRKGTNEDYGFLDQLLSSRNMLISHLTTVSVENTSLEAIFHAHISYARDAQDACIAGDFQRLASEELLSDTAALTADYRKESRFLPNKKAELTDQLMISGLCHRKLRRTAPFFYELCMLYFHSFDHLTAAQADARILSLEANLMDAHPEMKQVIRTYYQYYLLQDYLNIFESYSFLKVITLGIIHTHLLTLFLGLYFEKHHSLTVSEQARIISSYERRARHNTSLHESMYERTYPYLS